MAHTFDTNLRFTGSNNPLTQSYTCGSGATVLCLGIVTAGSVVRAGGAPTYNGVSLTQADSTRIYASSPETSCELWYLLAPPTGAAYTISVPNTGTKDLYVQASSYKAAAGYTSVLDVANGAIDLSSYANVTVTTTSDGDVIVAVAGIGYDDAPILQTGTSLNRTDDGTFSDSNQYKLQSTANPFTMAWLCNGSDDWCICAVAFKEASSVQTVSVTALSLTSAVKSPVVAITGDQAVAITAQALSLALKAPSVLIEGNQTILPSALNLSLSVKAPTVIATKNPTVSITALSLSMGLNNPSVAIQGNQTLVLTARTLTLSLKSPTVVIVNNITFLAPRFNLIATLKAPTCIVEDTVITWTLGHTQRITLKDDALVDFNPPAAASFLKLVINNTGAWTVTWPDEVFIDSVVPTNAISSVLFDYDGANYYGIIE